MGTFRRALCLLVLFADYGFGEFRSSFATKTAGESSRRRARRSVDGAGGAQLPGDDCPDCQGPFTPYFSGQCFMCPSGTPGPRGPPGQQGLPGRDGRDGRDAPLEEWRGTPEPSGEHSGDPSNLATAGAIYVRWGRDVCGSDSDLVYSGIAGGAPYNHAGGGSNYLCLPEEPIYDSPMAGSGGQSRAFVYGSEFQTSDFAPFSDLHDHDVPCAVCMAPARISLLTVPARNICPGNGWFKEYSGYLMAGKFDHQSRTEFVCMDRSPQIVPRTSHNANGVLFYPAEGRCGSNENGLPCGPYVDGYELTCAVCTR